MRSLALVAAALALVAGCGGESAAHKTARGRTHEAAIYYCTMGPAAPTEARPGEYRRCVQKQAAVFLKDWESKH